ncbi:hypothetical protein BHU72_04455 [Desulfuribacillus stibiiarsenatis]|uniref:Cell wall-active antibiotics response LiaF-like C-terminal domain-containing protein n=1 Tax=Desulfuribacillus stibiiarsenatis TaxID=1390249 RepID=A0A1E5L5F6_9FIRM|nr:cell wall-active antibiotics response protein [Desulfuribacillus stibiiarsenatis]OEH85350.1 hypothetical protein BHU72_04455 [Desulfuribacillus stibiiarsenatis]
MASMQRNFVPGLIVLGLGVLLLLKNLGFIEISIGQFFADFWPIILMIWGFQLLLRGKGNGFPFTGIILIAIGAILLGNKRGWYEIDLSSIFPFIWPVILILAGISLLRGPKSFGNSNVAFMGGFEKKKEQWKLEDGDFWAVMGGIELDVRKAILDKSEYQLNCTAIMGGIKITVPRDVTVICEGSAILGGVEIMGEGAGGIVATLKEKSIVAAGTSRATLRIYSRAIMGGIEIKAKGSE